MDDSSQHSAPEAIRAAVADRYSAIGVSPSSEETIPVGRAWAERLGYQVQYLKQPQREQMVVALFYELAGAGLIKGYRTLRNNTIDQYDALAEYRIAKKEIGTFEASGVKGLIKRPLRLG